MPGMQQGLRMCHLLSLNLLLEGLMFICNPQKQGSTEPTLENTALARKAVLEEWRLHEGQEGATSYSLPHPWSL